MWLGFLLVIPTAAKAWEYQKYIDPLTDVKKYSAYEKINDWPFPKIEVSCRSDYAGTIAVYLSFGERDYGPELQGVSTALEVKWRVDHNTLHDETFHSLDFSPDGPTLFMANVTYPSSDQAKVHKNSQSEQLTAEKGERKRFEEMIKEIMEGNHLIAQAIVLYRSDSPLNGKGWRVTFPLAGSSVAISRVLKACDIPIPK